MRIEGHAEKIKKLQGTLSKLDDEEDHETIIDLCMLISSHYINAALHVSGRLRPDKDIRHNKIFGALKREKYFGDESAEIAAWFKELEDMRPSQIYGLGKNGDMARKAKSLYSKIKKYCEGFLNV